VGSFLYLCRQAATGQRGRALPLAARRARRRGRVARGGTAPPRRPGRRPSSEKLATRTLPEHEPTQRTAERQVKVFGLVEPQRSPNDRLPCSSLES